MNPTEAVVDFLNHTCFEQIPPPVVTRSKELVLDCLGVIVAGSKHPAADMLVEVIRQVAEAAQASVVGKRIKTGAPLAALANGSMAHILDFDDTSRSMRDGHPTAPVLPSVLALGEWRGISGKKLLEAYIVGAEVEMKVASFVASIHADRGWHTTGTLGTLGAAVASAKVLGLGRDETRHALGIAVSQASSVIQNFGTMTKCLHAGAAAEHGVIAALLAERGFTSSAEALEGRSGFLPVFCGTTSDSLDGISESLGNPYDLISPGVDVKPYPCCSSTHGPIDGILELSRKYCFSPDEVKSIRCGVSYKVPKVLIYPCPRTDSEARFSLPFCLSVALVNGKVTPEQFTSTELADDRVLGLMNKIEMYVHPDLETRECLAHEFALVSVLLNNGKEYSTRINKGPGSISRALRGDEIIEKFKDCAQSLLDQGAIEETIRLVQNLENLNHVGTLMEKLCF